MNLKSLNKLFFIIGHIENKTNFENYKFEVVCTIRVE